MRRTSACTSQTSQLADLLHALSWAWVAWATVFMLAAALAISIKHGKMSVLRRKKSMPLVLIYLILLLFCITSLFVIVNVTCLAQTAWINLFWIVMGGAALGSLLPHLKMRLVVILLVVLLIPIGLEGGYRLYLRINPLDTTWRLQMDQHIGWRNIPDSQQHVWSGTDATCISSDTTISINSAGFYDAERTFQKPDNTLRIAILGDSFIEAVQVHDEQRVSNVLQRQLDSQLPDHSFEVMNFGISNFNVGQFWLTYENYVRQYQPDFVFVLLSNAQLSRIDPHGRYGIGNNVLTDVMQIRPAFSIDSNGELQVTPPSPADQATYAALQSKTIMDEDGEPKPSYAYSGVRRTAGSLWKNPYAWWVAKTQFGRFLNYRIAAGWIDFKERFFPTESTGNHVLSYYDYARGVYSPSASDNSTLGLHLAILNALRSAVEEDGAELVIMDDATPPFSDVLRYFAGDNHAGYLNLTQIFHEAGRKKELTL
ncbi:MAG TPA: SGNH/GDSL hydrolase family protein, partial [Aggregatilineales bacterium]|nr:SGNH/GDSL hydrolase family protein [Aggregatilineales bacterium]